MKGHGDKLGRKKEQAIAALLSEATVEAAAAKVGVSHSTLKKWLTDSNFQRYYRRARREVVEGAIVRLQQCATAAVLCLYKNLSCGNPWVEIGAARTILDHAVASIKLDDVLQRVEQLEAREAARQQTKPRLAG
jgi:hypothetical protein